MPPLRERREDIPLLADYFVKRICSAERVPVKAITAPALACLCRYGRPGNVRQLQNVIEMAIVMGVDPGRILPGDIELTRGEEPVTPTDAIVINTTYGLNYENTVAEFEKAILRQAMQQSGGNKSRAAGLLGLRRTTLSAKLRVLAAAA